MRRRFLPLALLTLGLAGCSGSDTPIASSTPTPGPSPDVSPTPTSSSPPLEPNVICGELTLFVDPALAASAVCETVPAEDFEFDPYPEHTRVTLTGYPLVGTFHAPHIAVYSVQEYGALAPGIAPEGTNALTNLTGGAPVSDWNGLQSDSLPFLPIFNAAQMFYSHLTTVPFGSGEGIRYLTQFTQAPVLINNAEVFYTFQGLTEDGQHWVSVILPVSHPTLPDDGESLPAGMTWEELAEDFDALLLEGVFDLSSQPEGSFVPALAALDALVATIVVSP